MGNHIKYHKPNKRKVLLLGLDSPGKEGIKYALNTFAKKEKEKVKGYEVNSES